MSDEECKWLPSSWWRCKMTASDITVMTPVEMTRWGWDATEHYVALYMCTARPREHYLCVAWVRIPLLSVEDLKRMRAPNVRSKALMLLLEESWTMKLLIQQCADATVQIGPSARPQLSYSNELMIQQKNDELFIRPEHDHLCTGCGT